jgi:hypothetical protein
MDFHLDCECGNRVAVTEGSAGATVDCACGRTIKVPSLSQLRKLHGLAPVYLLNPVREIESLREAGELPPGNECVGCGVPASDIVSLFAECERAWANRPQGIGGWITFLFQPWLFRWLRGGRVNPTWEGGSFGQNLTLPVPLRVCPDCRPKVEKAARAWDQTGIKEFLRDVEVYERLLDRYPDARITTEE